MAVERPARALRMRSLYYSTTNKSWSQYHRPLISDDTEGIKVSQHLSRQDGSMNIPSLKDISLIHDTTRQQDANASVDLYRFPDKIFMRCHVTQSKLSHIQLLVRISLNNNNHF